MTGRGRRCFVLGGGVAGLAAAFALRDRGVAVSLLESHGWLGGRAFSFVDRASGRRLDNGPHVMLGCYRAMRALLRRLGTHDAFAAQPALAMGYRDAAGTASRLRLSRWPVPLAMPFALRQLPLGGRGRRAALRGMLGVALGAPGSWTLAQWLRERGQDGAPAAYLWRPLCRAVMNVEPELASARLFLATLRQAFSGSAANAALLVPRRPWGEVVGDAAAGALAAAGCDVALHARVEALPRRDGRVAAIVLGDGRELPVREGDVVCSALPWRALDGLCDGALGAARLGASPLVSVWFDGELGERLPDDGAITALVDGEPFHFVYRTPGGARRSFALLAGGGTALDGIGVGEIERRARAQLQRHYPEVDAAAPATARIAKEARATFVAGPGCDALRPVPGALPDVADNLFVCGDWTRTGLPATLEGAARSADAMVARLVAR